MSNRIKLLFSIALMFLGSCFNSCGSCFGGGDENVLYVGTNANLPPFETVNAKGELEGFDIDLAKSIGKALNKEVKFKEFDFDALILALKKDQVDMIISALSITKDRQEEITMLPYEDKAITHISLLFWKETPKISDVSALKDMVKARSSTVTIQAGHFLENFFKDHDIPYKTLMGPPEQMLDIKYQKSLAAALDPKNAQELSQKHPDLKLVKLPLPEAYWDLGNGIGIKKTRETLASNVKKALETLRNDGTMKRLKEKWFKGKD